MNPLSPRESSRFAEHVYYVREQPDMLAAQREAAGMRIGDLFDIGMGKRVTGTSGPLVLKQESGFGYLAEGKGGRSGETILVLRGTDTARDWLTDGNIGLARGPSAWPVHAGFNDTFNSLRGQIDQYLRGKNPSAIHCIGHSLGGALATLAADYLSELSVAKIQLYTFGSPRVGVTGFARHLSEKLGQEGVNRVFHTADPVGMIPIFPYAHTPLLSPVCPLPWEGFCISPGAHSIGRYSDVLSKAESWRPLRRQPDPTGLEAEVRQWLDAANGNVLMLSATVFQMINKALFWLLKRSLNIVVGSALTGAVTLLDKLAWLLSQGAAACGEVAAYLRELVQRILRFLGRPLQAGVSLSVAFLRWVLDTLLCTIYGIAHRAIHRPFL
ncbi:MAG: lipase family protein [Gammaproteobacteria bacterium]|nr:lipase family protein [Gammaproteobacteria bacterium]